jgi:hypothetical protein
VLKIGKNEVLCCGQRPGLIEKGSGEEEGRRVVNISDQHQI